MKTLKMFLRVYELGSMSAAARDQRSSPAVASSRIGELEKRLGVRLFNRTTRTLHATENGRIFYAGAQRILEAIETAEAEVSSATDNPHGTVFVATPLGIGRRFIAPHVPDFKDRFPLIDVRLRLTDRALDITGEGLDVAFHLGLLNDSNLKLRVIADCPRVLCAAPAYIAGRGLPEDGEALINNHHACLTLRYPGATEFQWALQTLFGPRKFNVSGPFETDDGDVLTGWALDGRGIILKPVFEIAEHLASGALVPVATKTPPVPVHLACLYPHRKLKDAKVQCFTEFIIELIKSDMAAQLAGLPAALKDALTAPIGRIAKR